MDPELLKGTLTLLVLSLLSRKPMYGYQIVRAVREDTDGALRWKEGSLYPCLHKLAKDGLVVGEWDGEAGRRRRRYYHISEAGRTALAEKTASWVALARAVDRVLRKEATHGGH